MAEPDEPESFELDEPRRFEPTPPRYLPRLWKDVPEPEVAPEDSSAGSKKKRKRGEEGPETQKAGAKAKAKAKAAKEPAPDFDDGTGAAKLEETPVLDTFQTRQRIRLALGAALGAVGLLGLVLALRAFRGGNAPDAGSSAEVVEAKPTPAVRPSPEVEATALVENARQADKAGRTQAAIEALSKVAKVYPGTTAAKIAAEALERLGRSQPLFRNPLDQASGPKPPPEVKQPKAAPTPALPAPIAVGGAMPLPTAPNPPKESVATDATPGAPTNASVAKPDPAAIGKPLPAGFHAQPGTTIHPSGWPSRILCDRDGAPMVLVPGAAFLMGRDDGETSERPAHRVKLSTFYIDVHEVTVGQYQQFLGETGRPKAEATNPELPVVGIGAREAKAYCNWSNRRLPTEAQWELAARSTDGRISFWNGEPPRKDPPKGSRPMEPVMSLSSDISPYGAYDMGGNAWEWTQDWYDAQYYHQLPPLLSDPTGPSQSRVKGQVAVRGCSKLGILTEREGVRIEAKLPYLGFRGALPVDLAPAAATSKGAPAAPNTPNSGEIPF